eukprot:COSAG02_NODE_612_length_19541_cov_13.245150_6_plen_179_part_00
MAVCPVPIVDPLICVCLLSLLRHADDPFPFCGFACHTMQSVPRMRRAKNAQRPPRMSVLSHVRPPRLDQNARAHIRTRTAALPTCAALRRTPASRLAQMDARLRSTRCSANATLPAGSRSSRTSKTPLRRTAAEGLLRLPRSLLRWLPWRTISSTRGRNCVDREPIHGDEKKVCQAVK